MAYDVVVGIDPGKLGAFAVLSTDTADILDVAPMSYEIGPILHYLSQVKRQYGAIIISLEKAHGGGKDGVRMGGKSMFTYGRHFGQLETVIHVLKIPCQLVPPQTWTSELHKGAYSDTPKGKSREVALALFPGYPFTFSERAKKPHEGIVDAVLLAEYLRRRVA